MTKSDKKKFLIIDSRPFGMFSILMHTLDNIRWAEENGYIPVVRWGPGRWNPNAGRPGKEGQIETKTNRDHPKGGAIEKTNFFNPSEHELFEGFAPSGFEENGNMRGIKRCLYQENDDDNPWEYYFEPLNKHTIEEALQHEHLISDIFQYGGTEPEQYFIQPQTGQDFVDVRNKAFIIRSLEDYGRVYLRDLYVAPFFEELPQEEADEAINRYNDLQFMNRKNVAKYIKKITIKGEIYKKFQTFMNKNFGTRGPAISVHVRGTDKCSERAEESNYGLNYYLMIVEDFLYYHKKDFDEANVPLKIFLATDSDEVVTLFESTFGKETIVTYPSLRMNKYDSKTPIPLSKFAGRLHGEQCLIECLVLACSSVILGSDSNMSIFASYLNPAAKFIMIDPVAECAIIPGTAAIRI